MALTAQELLLELLDELGRKAAAFEEAEGKVRGEPQESVFRSRCRVRARLCEDLAAGWRQAYRAVLEGAE